MRRLKKTLSLVAFSVIASVALGSSPEQPISARLEPQPHGKRGVKLTVSRGAELGYDVEVRRAERARGGKPEFASVGRGLVSNKRSLVVEETPAPGPDGIVRLRYEISARSEAEGFDGVLVVSQAFVEGEDGSLHPIDYPELMRRSSGKPPIELAPGDTPAGVASSEPVE